MVNIQSIIRRGTNLLKNTLRILLIAVLLFVFHPVYAQGNLPPLAAVSNGQLYIYGMGAPVQVTHGSYNHFLSITWSPNGQHLAFTLFDANNNLSLMLTDRNGSAPRTVAQNVAHLPPTFTADSQQIIYTIEGAPDDPTGEPPGTPMMPLRVMAQGLGADAQPEQVGQLGFGVGCGGGSPYPMDGTYNAEAGFGGSRLIFKQTGHGLVYSTSCTGVGLALLDQGSGESLRLGDNLGRAVLSPDGAQIAAIRQGTITLVDLREGAQRDVPTQHTPDQIAWGDGQTLYYSVRTLLPGPLPVSEQEAEVFTNLFGAPADILPQYAVAIQRVDLGSGQESQVYSGPGWAVGRMFQSGGALYFSLVPNGEAWIEALASGEIDLNTREGYLRERQTAAVTMFRLAPGASAVEVGTDIGQAEPQSR
jgi:hypothetical protein